jgi:hypothetical protein
MALAELDHLADAANSEAGAAGSGLVIQAAVEHPAVVPALMPAHGGFLLENRYLGFGEALEQTVGRGEAEDPSSDDRDGPFLKRLGHSLYHKSKCSLS